RRFMSVESGFFEHRRGLTLDGQLVECFLLVGVKGALPDRVGFVVKAVERLAFTRGGGHQTKRVVGIALGFHAGRRTFIAPVFNSSSASCKTRAAPSQATSARA